MFGRVVQPRQPQGEECQVGTRRLHRSHVLDRDGVHRDESQRSIRFLHR